MAQVREHWFDSILGLYPLAYFELWFAAAALGITRVGAGSSSHPPARQCQAQQHFQGIIRGNNCYNHSLLPLFLVFYPGLRLGWNSQAAPSALLSWYGRPLSTGPQGPNHDVTDRRYHQK